jgi:hypothetical protein
MNKEKMKKFIVGVFSGVAFILVMNLLGKLMLGYWATGYENVLFGYLWFTLGIVDEVKK